MDILDKLRELESYYQATRAVGHTYAMMHGALHTDHPQGIIILAHDMSYARDLARQCIKKQVVPISLHTLEHGLRGHRKPLLIDNAALWQLLHEAATEIEKLRTELADTKYKAGWDSGFYLREQLKKEAKND